MITILDPKERRIRICELCGDGSDCWHNAKRQVEVTVTPGMWLRLRGAGMRVRNSRMLAQILGGSE